MTRKFTPAPERPLTVNLDGDDRREAARLIKLLNAYGITLGHKRGGAKNTLAALFRYLVAAELARFRERELENYREDMRT
jgi:hypothetical protein